MRFRWDVDFLAGALVIIALGVAGVAFALWAAWNDVGKWNEPRAWLLLAGLGAGGAAWVATRLKGGKSGE